MKKLIICEGKHDGMFIEGVLKNLQFLEEEFKIFNPKTLKGKTEFAESSMLNHFKSHLNPIKILIKQEGGRDSAIRIFSAILPGCVQDLDSVILILDLDESKLQKKMDKIKTIINTRYLTPYNITFEKKKYIENICYVEGTLNFQEQDCKLFHVVFFKDTLEKCCNVPENKVLGKEEIRQKINNFITKEIVDFFSPIFK